MCFEGSRGANPRSSLGAESGNNFWEPRTDGAVNKRNLSTGEDGEFGPEPAFHGLTTRPTAATLGDLRRERPVVRHAECGGYRRSFSYVPMLSTKKSGSCNSKDWLPSLNVIRTFFVDPPPESRLLLQQIQGFMSSQAASRVELA